MSNAKALLIVGTGHAGYTLAREFRKLDTERELILCSRDDGAAYYKPNLSKALAMGKTADDLVQFSAEQMAETLNARILSQRTVTALDPASRSVRAGNETLHYGDLVLASGANPIRLPLGGDAAGAVSSVNNLQDYRSFRLALAGPRRVLLIGAGLIGCEFANDLAANGHEVTAVDLGAWPLSALLPEACGRVLQDGLARIGVQWRLGNSITGISRASGELCAQFADGSSANFDVAVSAVGLRPDTQLASEAGIACEQGIVVNAAMRTSAENIWALGDCAQFHGRVMPYVLPIAHGARALAQSLAGQLTEAKFPAMPVMVKTPASPVLVCPPSSADGEWQLSGEGADLIARFVDIKGATLGFALTGAATRERAKLAAVIPPIYEPPGS